MEFRVLGVLEALEGGLPVSLGGPKQRSVLAMLLLDANRCVSTDRLVDGLLASASSGTSVATVARLGPKSDASGAVFWDAAGVSPNTWGVAPDRDRDRLRSPPIEWRRSGQLGGTGVMGR